MCGYKQKLPVFDVVPELKKGSLNLLIFTYIYLNTIKVLKITSNLLKKKNTFLP